MWYVSLGSGLTITDPFLGFLRDVFWRNGPPHLQDGVFRSFGHSSRPSRLNPGGVNEPIHVAILEKNPDANRGHPWLARMLSDDEVNLHRQNVDAARNHLREFKQKHSAAAAEADQLPQIPELPA